MILDHGDVPWIAVMLAAIVRDLLDDITALAGEDRGDLVAERARRHKVAHGISDGGEHL